MQSTPASDWVRRHAGSIEPAGTVLDLAAGSGRHTIFFKDLGHPVVALDRDVSRLANLTGDPAVDIVEADLEDGSPWPLDGRRFAGIVVTNYLHRPLLPHLARALAPSGVLIYETFGPGNERFGKPSNPNYLLRPGELLDFAEEFELTALAYHCGEVATPHRAMLQRAVLKKTCSDQNSLMTDRDSSKVG